MGASVSSAAIGLTLYRRGAIRVIQWSVSAVSVTSAEHLDRCGSLCTPTLASYSTTCFVEEERDQQDRPPPFEGSSIADFNVASVPSTRALASHRDPRRPPLPWSSCQRPLLSPLCSYTPTTNCACPEPVSPGEPTPPLLTVTVAVATSRVHTPSSPSSASKSVSFTSSASA